MEYLDHQFDGRVLGLGADLRGLRGHSSAPRSPDLSVLDFSIWSIMKRMVFTSPLPISLDKLEELITEVVDQLNGDPELIKKCHVSVRRRAQMCMEQIGGHFEFLR